MSEANDFKKLEEGVQAALYDTGELSQAARRVIERQAWKIAIEDQLTEVEIFNVLRCPEKYEAALDEYIKSRADPVEDELRKYQAIAYILQKLSYARAKILDEKRKEYGIKAVR